MQIIQNINKRNNCYLTANENQPSKIGLSNNIIMRSSKNSLSFGSVHINENDTKIKFEPFCFLITSCFNDSK